MSTQDNGWYILGSGAIGCLWAASWRAEHKPVVLILKQVSNHSMLELSCGQQATSFDVDTTTVEQLLAAGTQIQRLFVSTKAQHTQAAVRSLLPVIADDASVLVVQNGLAVTGLKKILPGRQLFAGVTTDGAYRQGPMQVTHAGKGMTTIGPLTKAGDDTLLEDLPCKGLSIEFCNNIEQRLWQKFALNCTINALTVKYQCRNGDLLTMPPAREELLALCKEVQQIAGLIKPANWFDNLAAEVQGVLTLTADNFNSMLEDVNNGRETEIAQLNGLLVQHAKAAGIPCPINQQLIAGMSQN